jgi:hypothetical protein
VLGAADLHTDPFGSSSSCMLPKNSVQYQHGFVQAETGERLHALSKRGRADMLLSSKPRGRELGLADEGYTYFGYVFDRLLGSRGYNQSTFAAECQRRGFKVGRLGKQRDIGQRSISDWMHGKTVCPREVPTYADAILGFSKEEWNEFALAYAYGQTVPKNAFEDLVEFREFYRAKLGEESESRAKKGWGSGSTTGASGTGGWRRFMSRIPSRPASP